VERADYNGVFSPNSAHRAQVTRAKRGKGNRARTADAAEDTTSAVRQSRYRPQQHQRK
jgi:hypothetical protein